MGAGQGEKTGGKLACPHTPPTQGKGKWGALSGPPREVGGPREAQRKQQGRGSHTTLTATLKEGRDSTAKAQTEYTRTAGVMARTPPRREAPTH